MCLQYRRRTRIARNSLSERERYALLKVFSGNLNDVYAVNRLKAIERPREVSSVSRKTPLLVSQ